MKLISSSPFLCLFLIPSLVVFPLGAQSPLVAPAGMTPAQNSSAVDNTDLQLRVVDGSAPEAKVNSTVAKGLTVAVSNSTGAAVADAAVALRLPDSGATGTFADGSHAAVAYTDSTGLAHFAALHWNQTPGAVSMRVTATKGTSHAALLLNETLTSDVTTVVRVPAAAAASAPAVSQPAVPQAVPQQPAAVQPQPAVQQKPAVQQSPAVAQPGQTQATQPIARSGAAPVIITAIPPATTGAAKPEPTVSVTGAGRDSSSHSGKTKWIILAVVAAAGAGAGVAVMGKSKSAPAATTNSLVIGTPSVSVGH